MLRKSSRPLDSAKRSEYSPDVRLLIVEDDPRISKILTSALEEDGYAIDSAADGIEGLYKAENTEYDAIVLDVMLPGLDGWELLKRLRRTRKTPVLMLTARDATGDRVKGLDTGADDYLVKPFELDELFARIRSIIRRSAGVAQSEVTLGDITIDIGARTVTRAGELVQLTPREYGIFEFLAVHRGKVITRTQLFEHIFDEQADPMSNLVDVHVANVRKKLGRDLIVTRRGHGFCIES
jgi:two-component system OmpR family response regulator